MIQQPLHRTWVLLPGIHLSTSGLSEILGVNGNDGEGHHVSEFPWMLCFKHTPSSG